MKHAAWVALVVLLTASSARATPPASGLHVRVRGTAQVQAIAATEDEGVVVSGELADDVAAPIPRGPLSVQVLGADGAALSVLPAAEPCTGRHHVATKRVSGRDAWSIEADEHGAFCLRAPPLEGGARVRVSFEGSPLYSASSVEAPLEAGPAHAARARLQFDPLPDVLDLERDTQLVTGWLRLERPAVTTPSDVVPRREGLRVSLEDERGEHLGEATTAGDGRLRFEVPSKRMGPPGEGELALRFDGNDALAATTTTQPVVRRAEVALALEHAVETSDPEGGVTIDVAVTSPRGAVSGGVVEALSDGASVGAGGVENGRARVIATFAPSRADTAPLTLRYVSAAPWWRAGRELAVDVRIVPEGPLRPIALAVVVLAVAAWIIAGWRRAPKPARPDGAHTAPPPSGRPGATVLAPSPTRSGWSGVVSDAHDGSPIAGATVRIVAPAFDGDGTVASAIADEHGAFSIDAEVSRSDARLVVEARAHATHEQPLPPASVLSIALVTRRRALVDRLVRWARRQGSPFDGPPEPTPGHVRRVAARTRASGIEAWATQVEHAAFGPDPVDEQVEREVRDAEPNHSAGNAR